MDALLFGTAGIPHSTEPRSTENGIAQVKKLGLGAMEIEFVHSVNISAAKAPIIKKIAQQENVILTCHAPYYINLNAAEDEKRQASVGRILNSARVLAACGGYSVCFHAGFYLGMPHPQAYDRVKEGIVSVMDTLKTEGIDIWIRPEIGGKTTSWGSLEEIIRVAQEVPGVLPCIDWAHMHARSLGKNNSYDEFAEILTAMEKGLGKKALKELHCHVEGIEIGKTGEKNHLNFEQTDYQYQELMRAFKDFNCKGVIICESPNIERDALAMKKAYEGI